MRPPPPLGAAHVLACPEAEAAAFFFETLCLVLSINHLKWRWTAAILGSQRLERLNYVFYLLSPPPQDFQCCFDFFHSLPSFFFVAAVSRDVDRYRDKFKVR